MYNKIFERIAQVITALLFVVSVILFAIIFIVDPLGAFDRPDVTHEYSRPTSVEEIEIVKPEITTLVDTREVVSVPTTVEGDIVEIELSYKETVEENVTDTIVPNQEEVELLAKVIYQEAGGDECCDECRRRVADVVLNRVADTRFPNTIEGVLTEVTEKGYGAYGRYHWTGVIWPEKAKLAVEAHAVERAYRIAEEVLSGKHSELYGNGYIWQAEFVQGTDNKTCCNMFFGRG